MFRLPRIPHTGRCQFTYQRSSATIVAVTSSGKSAVACGENNKRTLRRGNNGARLTAVMSRRSNANTYHGNYVQRRERTTDTRRQTILGKAAEFALLPRTAKTTLLFRRRLGEPDNTPSFELLQVPSTCYRSHQLKTRLTFLTNMLRPGAIRIVCSHESWSRADTLCRKPVLSLVAY